MNRKKAEELTAVIVRGLEEFEETLQKFIDGVGWDAMGYGTLREWWDAHIKSARLGPVLRTKVLAQFAAEQESLPKAQRESQRALGARVGAHRDTVSGRNLQDPPKAEVPPISDLASRRRPSQNDRFGR